MAKLSIDAALKQAKQHEKKGETAQARALYAAVLKAVPGHDTAKKALNRLPAGGPGVSQQALADLVARFKARRFAEVVQQGRKILAAHPDAAMVWNLVGIAEQHQGRTAEAAQAFERAVRLRPDMVDAQNNLGLALARLGRPADAVACFRRALEARPDADDTRVNLAMMLRDAQQPDAARVELDAVLSRQPDHAKALFHMGNVLRDLGDHAAAVTRYRRVLELAPDALDARNNLGIALKALGRFEEAAEAYRAVLAVDKTSSDVYCNLFELCDKLNRQDEARALLAEVETRFDPLTADLRFCAGVYHHRAGAFDAAVAALTSYDVGDIKPVYHQQHHELLGKSLEKLGRYADAFAAFQAKNTLVRGKVPDWAARAQVYLDRTLARAAAIADLPPPQAARSDGDGRDAPVFLVGFPRSGTTLLDTFLRGHPDIVVAEETRALAKAQTEFDQFLPPVTEIEALDPAVLDGMRDIYFAEFDKHAVARGAGVRVDKLPLHLISTPEIHAMFPRARFILALRHPLDCILSNFKQNFQMNNAMYLMTDIVSAARLYDASMRIFQDSAARYDLPVVTLRYEDLVEDQARELRRVVDFLDLPWTDDLLDHTKTAKSRDKINTPSFSQVVKPVYRDSSFLWTNYAQELSPCLPHVSDWIARYGYGDLDGPPVSS